MSLIVAERLVQTARPTIAANLFSRYLTRSSRTDLVTVSRVPLARARQRSMCETSSRRSSPSMGLRAAGFVMIGVTSTGFSFRLGHVCT